MLVAALNALVGPVALGGPAPANAADPCAPAATRSPARTPSPAPTRPSGTSTARATRRSRASPPTSRSTSASGSTSRSTPTPRPTRSTSTGSATTSGNGARKITSVDAVAPRCRRTSRCITDVTTELYDCGNWAVSASWNVPSTAVSGVYIAHLKRSNGDASHITFIVRDDASTSDVVFQTSDPTWQAYNTYGGSNFYQGGANGRAYKLSYNRPLLHPRRHRWPRLLLRQRVPDGAVPGAQRLRRQLHRRRRHRPPRRPAARTTRSSSPSATTSTGAAPQRANVEAARDAGVNLQFLSGNEVYWRTRYEPSADASHTAYRTLVSYKETWANAKIDPTPGVDRHLARPAVRPAAPGRRPPGERPDRHGVHGQLQRPRRDGAARTRASSAVAQHRRWRRMTAAQHATLAPHTVGYESNEDLDNGFRPAGPDPAVHDHRADAGVPAGLRQHGRAGHDDAPPDPVPGASGALVFSAGTVQWTWGLDAEHDGAVRARARRPAHAAGAGQPARRHGRPADHADGRAWSPRPSRPTPPARPSPITSPAAGAAQPNGTQRHRHRHRVRRRRPGGRGRGLHRRRRHLAPRHRHHVVDLHLRPERARAAAPCRCARSTTAPTSAPSRPRNVHGDLPVLDLRRRRCRRPRPPTTASRVELGLRFTPTVDGFVTGVRFYKGAGNTGTHVGSLWSRQRAAAGHRSPSPTRPPPAGRPPPSARPSPLTAGPDLRRVLHRAAAATTPSESWRLLRPRPRRRRRCRSPAASGRTAGRRVRRARDVPRARATSSANYFVDVTFTTTDDSPLIGDQPVRRCRRSSASRPRRRSRRRFSKPIGAGHARPDAEVDANGATVAGTTSYDAATRTITFTPTRAAGGVRPLHRDAAGHGHAGQPGRPSGRHLVVHDRQAADRAGGLPVHAVRRRDHARRSWRSPTAAPVTLGVRFTSDVDGTVTGVRFYKGAEQHRRPHRHPVDGQTASQLATGHLHRRVDQRAGRR